MCGETYAEKARDFIGKECLDREDQGTRTQENDSALWFVGFMVMRLVSGCLWPIILTQGPSCGADNAQARQIPSRTVGGGRRCGISFGVSGKIEGRRRKGQQKITEDEMVGWHH